MNISAEIGRIIGLGITFNLGVAIGWILNRDEKENVLQIVTRRGYLLPRSLAPQPIYAATVIVPKYIDSQIDFELRVTEKLSEKKL